MATATPTIAAKSYPDVASVAWLVTEGELLTVGVGLGVGLAQVSVGATSVNTQLLGEFRSVSRAAMPAHVTALSGSSPTMRFGRTFCAAQPWSVSE